MGERTDGEIPRPEQQDDEEDKLQPNDPFDLGQVDERQEDDDDGCDGALRHRVMHVRDDARDGLAEAGGAQGVADRLKRVFVFVALCVQCCNLVQTTELLCKSGNWK